MSDKTHFFETAADFIPETFDAAGWHALQSQHGCFQ